MITRIVLLVALCLSFASPILPTSGNLPPDSAASAISILPEVGPIVPELSGCGGITPPVTNAAYEQQVVEQVNAQRWANGRLPPYKRISALDAAARYHSVDMGQDNYFDHPTDDRISGNLVTVCAWNARVSLYYNGAMAENIAAGYPNPASVMAGWMSSPGHRDNILNADAWEIGVGFASGSGTYGTYWTQDFGRQNGIYPLVINREAAITLFPDVSLYIYGQREQMRLKNENGAWTAWGPFQNNVAWRLSPGLGTKTVTAELKSGTTIVSSSDTIDLKRPTYFPTIFR